MEIRAERDTEVHSEGADVYEPPILDEVGEFIALTRGTNRGKAVDGTGYYPE